MIDVAKFTDQVYGSGVVNVLMDSCYHDIIHGHDEVLVHILQQAQVLELAAISRMEGLAKLLGDSVDA